MGRLAAVLHADVQRLNGLLANGKANYNKAVADLIAERAKVKAVEVCGEWITCYKRHCGYDSPNRSARCHAHQCSLAKHDPHMNGHYFVEEAAAPSPEQHACEHHAQERRGMRTFCLECREEIILDTTSEMARWISAPSPEPQGGRKDELQIAFEKARKELFDYLLGFTSMTPNAAEHISHSIVALIDSRIADALERKEP